MSSITPKPGMTVEISMQGIEKSRLDEIEAAESLRKANEAERTEAELMRKEGEAGRITAEQERTMEEDARNLAESGRILAEESRVTAENLRSIGEQSRAEAEKGRSIAESGRANAEALRKQTFEANEANRHTAFESAENARESEWTEIKHGMEISIGTAVEDANSAAESANAAAEKSVRYDEAQTLDDAQKAQARGNIDAADEESVDALKGDLDSFTRIERSPNLFNKDDANITSNAQISNNGEVMVHSAWSSSVTDFLKINATESRTLRQTLATNIRIAEYKADETFISITTINSSSPITLNDETEKIRIEFHETSGLMVYQSDTKLPYEDYYVNILVNEDAIPTTIARKNDVEIELALLDGRVSSLEEYEITNYALFVDTYEGKAYDSNGKLTNNASYNATSICKLDRTRPIRPSNIYTGHAVFFDENKSYISTVNCYGDSHVGVSAYPENAVYVAFDYVAGTYSCGEWGTYWKRVQRGSSLENISLSNTKKRKGTRPIINIYTIDTQMEILAKLCDAFHTEDCDVVFERGEYTFDSVFVDMHEKGQRNYIELPIGGRCRYYFNGSTLTADQSVFNEAGYSGTISLFSCIYNLNSSESYELYDGTLIGKGITYVVHDECGGKPNWYSHRYKNMKFIYQTDSQTNYIRKPIGGGTGLFGESIFENCTFETDNTYDLSFHGIETDKEDISDFKLVLSNCYLSKRISLDNLATNQTASLLMSGCSAKYIHQTGMNNKWGVTSWCNEVRTE